MAARKKEESSKQRYQANARERDRTHRLNLLFNVKMVSVVRGRGWAQTKKDSLPKPGRPLCSEDTNYMNFIKIINLVDNENLAEKVDEFVKLINEELKQQSLKNIHDKLYKCALNDREFGQKLSMVYDSRTIRNARFQEDMNLYKLFVNCLQADYERRKELKEENVTHFHNTLCLFSDFLNSFTMSVPSRLQSAFLDYMEMLLETASEDDIKIFMEQVIAHRKHLCNNEKLHNLLISARQILIEGKISSTSRQMLLYVIDLESRDFQPLPNDLAEFYKSQLDKNYIHIPQKSASANNRDLRTIRGSNATDFAK
ncbi:uncharacterized protein LOC143425862 [Xylocopa sonorina]|uniref:uncharacterized protein LOC143425862 n=1 Tax=Xylocopa sonorina TaxID=1818115 RepID=UPI00403A7C84